VDASVKECVRIERMSCPTLSKISFINFYNNFVAAMWLWTNGTFKSSLHSPSKGTYLDFAKNSGRPGHLESGLLIQGANEKIAGVRPFIRFWETVIYRVVETPQFPPIFRNRGSQTVYSVFKNQRLPRSRNTAVSACIKKPNKPSDYRYLKKLGKTADCYTVI